MCGRTADRMREVLLGISYEISETNEEEGEDDFHCLAMPPLIYRLLEL
jgi:hypothetical protein